MQHGWKFSEPLEPIDINYKTFILTDIITKATGEVFISAPPSLMSIHQTTQCEPLSWTANVKSLLALDRSLIENNWEVESSRGLCAELINESASVMIISDGGQADDFGSYSWVISIQNEVLWEGTGSALGQPMMLQRGDAYVKLAWM